MLERTVLQPYKYVKFYRILQDDAGFAEILACLSCPCSYIGQRLLKNDNMRTQYISP